MTSRTGGAKLASRRYRPVDNLLPARHNPAAAHSCSGEVRCTRMAAPRPANVQTARGIGRTPAPLTNEEAADQTCSTTNVDAELSAAQTTRPPIKQTCPHYCFSVVSGLGATHIGAHRPTTSPSAPPVCKPLRKPSRPQQACTRLPRCPRGQRRRVRRHPARTTTPGSCDTPGPHAFRAALRAAAGGLRCVRRPALPCSTHGPHAARAHAPLEDSCELRALRSPLSRVRFPVGSSRVPVLGRARRWQQFGSPPLFAIILC